MKRSKNILIICLFLCFFSFSVEANIIGFIFEATGKVLLISGQNDPLPIEPGTLVNNGGMIKVLEGSQATLKFRDGSDVILYENTEFVIEVNERLIEGKRSIISKLLLKSGSLWANILRGNDYTFKTPTATIKGKEATIRLQVDPAQNLDQISVGEGTVEVITDTSSVRLEEGEQLQFAPKTKTPSQKTDAAPVKIELTSLEKNLYLPRSGRLRVKINATLNGIDPLRLQQLPLVGTITTDSLNVVIPNSRFIFNQPTISFEVDAIGSGFSKIYAVLDQNPDTPAVEGQLTIDVKAVKHKKIVKIKTIKGVLIMKLAPK